MKTVLITGATGGIGNALVHKFYDAGYNILATGTNNDKLNLLHDNFNERVKCVKCDLSDKNDINNLVEEANKSYQIIDILINNAGITRDNLFIRMSDDDWDKVININLTANFRLTKLLIKGMIKNRWGRIINITSDAAKIGNPGQSNYVASKSAIEGMTRTLANEVASRGVTVNCVSPGFIKTEILKSIDKSRLETMSKQVPLGRIGETKEIADIVFFLTSEESSYITGQVLHVNGGLTM
jgi:3-oxoacyl-[acyl-carrier protein] reductase